MSSQRRLGVLFGLLAFLGISAAALLSSYQGDFASGLPGIEADLTAKSEARLVALGIADAAVEADGQDISVVIPAGWDSASVEAALLVEDGVRNVDVTLRPPGPDTEVAPEPTAVEPAPEPTAVEAPTAAATAAPEPTAEPPATAAPAPEPTATATAAPTPEPPATAAEVVAGLDLTAVNFVPGTSRLTERATAVLDGIAPTLLSLDGVPLEVQGHSDSLGDPDANLLLSFQRAAAVVEHLVSRGVEPSTLTARGYGAANPVATNSTEQGRAANRRVALVLVEGN